MEESTISRRPANGSASRNRCHTTSGPTTAIKIAARTANCATPRAMVLRSYPRHHASTMMTAISAVTSPNPAREAAATTDATITLDINQYTKARGGFLMARYSTRGNTISMNTVYRFLLTNGPRTKSSYPLGKTQKIFPSEVYIWSVEITLRAKPKYITAFRNARPSSALPANCSARQNSNQFTLQFKTQFHVSPRYTVCPVANWISPQTAGPAKTIRAYLHRRG